MLVKLNTVELADRLAWERLKLQEGFSTDEEAENVMFKSSGDVLTFTDLYQDKYNELYDYYSTIVDLVVKGE